MWNRNCKWGKQATCQKTSAAYHHLDLESVNFSAFNAFITEQIRAAEIGRLSKTQELLLQVSYQEITVYVDFLLCGCTTSTTLIVADRDVDQKMQVIKASVIEHVMKYLQHIQTFASLISYSIQLFINIFLRKVRLEYGRKVVLEELSHHFM